MILVRSLSAMNILQEWACQKLNHSLGMSQKASTSSVRITVSTARFVNFDALPLLSRTLITIQKIVHQTLTELYDGVPNSYPMGHAFHCIDVLRQDAVCLADDTPLFTSLEHPGSPGRNQGRLCRDWSKLEKFAWDHTSCWRDISPTKHIETNLLRYRYCPAGSQYNEKILEEFPGFDIEGNVRMFGS